MGKGEDRALPDFIDGLLFVEHRRLEVVRCLQGVHCLPVTEWMRLTPNRVDYLRLVAMRT